MNFRGITLILHFSTFITMGQLMSFENLENKIVQQFLKSNESKYLALSSEESLPIMQINNSGISLGDLTQIVSPVQFTGKWRSNSLSNVFLFFINAIYIQKQFGFFNEYSGDAYMIFITNSSSLFFKDSMSLISQMEIQMLDPKYQEEREVFSFFHLNEYDQKSVRWASESYLNYTMFYKFKNKGISQGKCAVEYAVQVSFSNLGKKASPNLRDCAIRVDLKSKDLQICQIDFSIDFVFDTNVKIIKFQSLHKQNQQLQIILYCLYVNFICTIQFVCVTKMCKDLLENDENIQRISLLSVGFITVCDSYLCLQNLYFALLNYVYFQYFIIPSFFYFILSSTCDMKLMWIVWRYRYANEIMNNQQLRKSVAMFFFKFYGSLVGYFILMFFLQLDNWFIMLTSLYFVPQIVHNVQRGNNPRFIPEYILGVLSSNMFYPLYFRGCPHNFRGLQPSNTFCIGWVSSFALQIFILFAQNKFGPHCFIPKCFLPKQYNYYKQLTLNSEEELDDCAICLGSLLMEPDLMEQSLESKFISKKIMQTPCGHKFHIICLRDWLNVKLSCPTCRKDCPPAGF